MKSKTDIFWNERSSVESDVARVNISDTVQRDHELQFILKNLNPAMRVLEVGCGNGYVSQQLRSVVAHLDAFDYAENMVESARKTYGEKNNRFFHDSVLSPKNVGRDYDAAICVRVLINLRNLEEQRIAVQNMARVLKPGGRLILIEGYRDGFDALTKARQKIGLSALQPASINFYSYIRELMPELTEHFAVEQTWHTGMFDFLTRIVYPQLVGPENVEPGEFHAKIEPIVRTNSLPDLINYARLLGFSLIRKQSE
jgi:SAM-dependent methyltransferase